MIATLLNYSVRSSGHAAKRRRWALCVSGLAVLLVFTLAGCGGNSESDAEAADASSQESSAMTTAAPDSMQDGKLNLNTATREAFLTVPDVGDRMVREFFEYRPYVSIRQFRQEIGKYVDAEQVAAYEQHVFVPVDPNECDAATLQQLPGVDADAAQALIDGRPYASTDAFLERLSTYVPSGELTVAQSYLATS